MERKRKSDPISSATTIGNTDTMDMAMAKGAQRGKVSLSQKNNARDSFHRQRLQFIPKLSLKGMDRQMKKKRFPSQALRPTNETHLECDQ